MDDSNARDRIPTLANNCTLDDAKLEQRLDEIERLTSWALRERYEEAGSTVVAFDRTAASQVRDLVRRERDCCGHLDFRVAETEEAVRVTIRQRQDVGPGGIEPPSDGL